LQNLCIVSCKKNLPYSFDVVYFSCVLERFPDIINTCVEVLHDVTKTDAETGIQTELVQYFLFAHCAGSTSLVCARCVVLPVNCC
jgi:hypothetical protein